MGIGGAFIMPSTLSLITNVFPPEERGRAISYWAAIAGIGVALGPVSGGLLLEHFYWGSIFLVNLPIVAVALVAGGFLLPKSSDPAHPRLDLVGASLSIVGLMALVYGIIDGPLDGWGSGRIVGAFAAAAVLLGAFAWWESHSSHPMLNLKFFKNPRFTAASSGLMLIFFAMFGATFLLTQYLQFVMGYSPLRAGYRAAAVGRDHARRRARERAPRRALRHEARGRRGAVVRDRVAAVHEHAPVHAHQLRRATCCRGCCCSRSAWASRWRPPPSRSWARCRAPRPVWARR